MGLAEQLPADGPSGTTPLRPRAGGAWAGLGWTEVERKPWNQDFQLQNSFMTGHHARLCGLPPAFEPLQNV